jgi:hypothetical protein
MIKCRLVLEFRTGDQQARKKMASNIQSRVKFQSVKKKIVKFQCFCFHSGHHACYEQLFMLIYDENNSFIFMVRGLSSRARQDMVRELVAEERPSIVCKTKLYLSS